MSRWYMAMDVFVFSSLLEGMSLAAMEDQIAGLPSVMSTRVAPGNFLSERAEFVDLDAGVSVWARQIRKAAAGGRGGDLTEELTRRNLNITTEARKLDHFYRYGVWK